MSFRAAHLGPIVGAVFLLLALGLMACGDDDTESNIFIREWVVADGPVAGAQVSMLDHEGEAIDGATGTSFDTGTFSLPVDRVPQQFTVVAKGGR